MNHPQNMTNSAISLVVYDVIPLKISPPAWALITSVMYHLTEPKGEQYSGRNLGKISNGRLPT